MLGLRQILRGRRHAVWQWFRPDAAPIGIIRRTLARLGARLPARCSEAGANPTPVAPKTEKPPEGGFSAFRANYLPPGILPSTPSAAMRCISASSTLRGRRYWGDVPPYLQHATPSCKTRIVPRVARQELTQIKWRARIYYASGPSIALSSRSETWSLLAEMNRPQGDPPLCAHAGCTRKNRAQITPCAV